MVDAIVGGVIMVVATTSLFLAYEVAEKAMNSVGRYCLTEHEKVVLQRAKLSSNSEFYSFWNDNLKDAPIYSLGGTPTPLNTPSEQCKSES